MNILEYVPPEYVSVRFLKNVLGLKRDEYDASWPWTVT